MLGGILHHFEEERELVLDGHRDRLSDAYRVTTDTYQAVAETIYAEAIARPDVVDLFARATRTDDPTVQNSLRQALFERLSPQYASLQRHGLKQLHFHFPDGRSFLRFHRPEKYGDPLFDVRPTLARVRRTEAPVYAFEEGRIFNGFRYVFPVFSGVSVTDVLNGDSPSETLRDRAGGAYAGSVETSVGFPAIRSSMERVFEAHYQLVLSADVVDRKVFSSEQDNYQPSFISTQFLAENTAAESPWDANPISPDILRELSLDLRDRATPRMEDGETFALFGRAADEDYIAAFLPIHNIQDELVAYVLAFSRDRELTEYRREVALEIGILTAVIAAAILAFYQWDRNRLALARERDRALEANQQLERSVERQMRVAERLAQTNESLQQEVQARTRAELQEKQRAHQLRKTLRRLKMTQTQLVHQEKMSSLGKFVGGIAHEINNPLSFIRGNLKHASSSLETLLEALDRCKPLAIAAEPELVEELEELDLDFVEEDLPRIFDSMESGATRIEAIVKSLRSFSRLDESDLKTTALQECLDSTLILLDYRLRPTAYRDAITVEKRYGTLPPVECYPGALNQVFASLLENAIDAIDDRSRELPAEARANYKGCIALALHGTPDGRAFLRVTDNGVGMPPAVADRAFDPFFTTKAVGQGSGLGLSTSYAIVVKRHGGSISCRSDPGKGTTFCLWVPLTQRDREASPAAIAADDCENQTPDAAPPDAALADAAIADAALANAAFTDAAPPNAAPSNPAPSNPAPSDTAPNPAPSNTAPSNPVLPTAVPKLPAQEPAQLFG